MCPKKHQGGREETGSSILLFSATVGMAKNQSGSGILSGNSQIRAWHLTASGDLKNPKPAICVYLWAVGVSPEKAMKVLGETSAMETG